MNIRRAYAIAFRQFYLIRGHPTRFWQMFVWITVDVIIWGYITKYLTTVVPPSFGVLTFFLGAVVLWGFLLRVMQGMTTSFLEDVWSKNFLNLFASPLKISEYIVGLVLTSILTSILVLSGVIALASLVFGFSLFTLGVYLAPFLLILFLFGIALGIFGVAIVLRIGPSAEWFVWPIPAVLNPFVGVFYPVSTLPDWMRVVSKALPPSYVFEGMRTALLSGTFSSLALVEGVVLAVLYIVLAYAFFVYVYRTVVRNGLIARFEAEGP
ncbi:MAG: ABC transporter permease [Patescibacteria group bacterium]